MGDVVPAGVTVLPDVSPGLSVGCLMSPFAQALPRRKPRTMQPVISKNNDCSMLLPFIHPVAPPGCLIISLPYWITMR